MPITSRILRDIARFALAALLTVFLAPSFASATTYYVRISGSDTNSGTTPTTAWRTPQKALNTVVAGDVVYVGAGSYTGDLSPVAMGTLTNPIRLIADKAGVFTGDAGTVALVGQIILLNDQSFEFHGWKIAPTADVSAVTGAYSTDITFIDCTLTARQRGIDVDGCDLYLEQCSISNNLKEGIRIERATNYYSGSRKKWKHLGITNTATESEIMVRRCTIENNGLEGIVMRHSSVAVIEDSIIRNNKKRGIKTDSETGVQVSVTRCLVQSNGEVGIRIKRPRAAVIENCLIMGHTEAGIRIGKTMRSGGMTDDSDDDIDMDGGVVIEGIAQVQHCTLAKNTKYGIFIEEKVGCDMKSSIVYSSSTGLKNKDNSPFTHSYLIVFGCNKRYDGTVAGSFETALDPKFSNVTANDYRLVNGSPAIDAAPLIYSQDLDGKSRPVGPLPDLGCYEAGASAPVVYYVRTDGNDNNNGRSPSTAFRTIGQAADVVRAGDIVYVGGGTYREAVVSRSIGSSSSPIQFIADTSGQKTGVGGTVTVAAPAGQTWAWTAFNNHYTSLTGFRFASLNAPASSGLFTNNCLVFSLNSCTFDACAVGYSTLYSAVDVNGCTFQDTTTNSLVSNQGVLALRNSVFQRNAVGPTSQNDAYFYGLDTTISSTTGDAAIISRTDRVTTNSVAGTVYAVGGMSPSSATEHAHMKGCSFTNNGSGPKLDLYTAFDQFKFTNVNNTGNTNWSFTLSRCTLTFGPDTKNKWALGTGKNGLYVTTSSDVTFNDLTFDNFPAGYPLYGTNSKIALNRCEMKNNKYGMGSEKNTTFTANTSLFHDNSEFGLAVWGKCNLTSCQLYRNKTGLQLQESTDSDVALDSTTITNNTETGLSAIKCTLSFSPTTTSKWRFSGNPYVIVGNQSSLTFDRYTVNGGSEMGVLAEAGTLVLTSATFSGNKHGLYSKNNTSFTATQSQFQNNTGYGLMIAGKGTLNTCVLNNNLDGLWLSQATNAGLGVYSTQIANNSRYGVYMDGCNLVFNAAAQPHWQVSNNDIQFGSTASQLTFDSFAVSGGRTYGVYATNGTVQATNASFTGNGTGVYALLNTSFIATNSSFSNNSGTGLLVRGPATLTGCSLNTNNYGLGLQQATTSNVVCVNTTASQNRIYGVLLEECSLTLNAAAAAGLTVQNNQHGYGVAGGTVTLQGFTVQSNSGYGVYLDRGQLTLDQMTLTRNGGGTYVSPNGVCVGKNAQFSTNTNYGMYVDSGQASLTDCRLQYNADGLVVNDVVNADLTLQRVTLANNTNRGFVLNRSTFTFDQTLQSNGLQISQNTSANIHSTAGALTINRFNVSNTPGYGIVALDGTLTLSNSQISACGVGLHANGNTACTLQSATFTGNTQWGAYLHGPVTLSGCRVENNVGGLWVYNNNGSQLALGNTQITNNTGTGLLLDRCDLTLDDQRTSNWTISGNGTGIAAQQGRLRLSNAVLGTSHSYALTSTGGSLTVTSSTLPSENHGILLEGNDDATITASRVSGGSGWGILNYDGPATIQNCVLSHFNGGLYIEGQADQTTTVWNTTLAELSNVGVYQANGNTVLTNLILAGSNGIAGLSRIGGTMQHSYNLVYGFQQSFSGTAAGAGETTKNPRFVNAAAGDYRLAVGSPAINAGADLSAFVSTDIDGNARPAFRVFELGAHEYVERNGSLRVLEWAERQ